MRGNRKSLILILLTLVIAAGMLTAAEMREIVLTDGTIITGEVVSLTGGICTIRSATLGTVQVKESNIRTIRLKDSAGSSALTEREATSLQNKMMSDGEIMNKILGLQNDPEFQEVLQDPEIMKAVQAGDIAALTANPKFMRLLNNQAVKDIKDKLTR
jgi:hypothetical protein